MITLEKKLKDKKEQNHLLSTNDFIKIINFEDNDKGGVITIEKSKTEAFSNSSTITLPGAWLVMISENDKHEGDFGDIINELTKEVSSFESLYLKLKNIIFNIKDVKITYTILKTTQKESRRIFIDADVVDNGEYLYDKTLKYFKAKTNFEFTEQCKFFYYLQIEKNYNIIFYLKDFEILILNLSCLPKSTKELDLLLSFDRSKLNDVIEYSSDISNCNEKDIFNAIQNTLYNNMNV